MAESDSLRAIDTVAAALIRAAKPIYFKLAPTRSDAELAQALRARVILERGWTTPWELAEGQSVDPDDARAVHILALLGELPVGACRLVFPEPGQALPMNRRIAGLRAPAGAAELGRIVASRADGARAPVMAGLIGAAWISCRSRGVQRMCGTVPESMLRLYRRLGFVVQILGEPVTLSGATAYPILFEPTEEAAAVAMSHIPGRG